MSEVTNRLFATGQKVTQLFGKIERQNKSISKNAETLRDLLVGIENLGDTLKKINEEMDYWRNLEVLEVEDELNRLQDPVSLTVPVSKGPEIVNILSSDDSAPTPWSLP